MVEEVSYVAGGHEGGNEEVPDFGERFGSRRTDQQK